MPLLEAVCGEAEGYEEKAKTGQTTGDNDSALKATNDMWKLVLSRGQNMWWARMGNCGSSAMFGGAELKHSTFCELRW